MWLFFALLSGLLYTGSNLITRHILKKDNNDAWAFSFFFSAVGTLVSLPFMLLQPRFGTQFQSWLIILVVGILIVIQNLLNFVSSKYISPSVGGSITKFRLVWVMLLGIIILHESSNLFKIMGTLLTVISGVIIMKKFLKPKDMRGVAYAFGATIFYATVIILYKFLFSSFNSQSLTFFIFFIPMVINLLIMPNSIKRIGTLAKGNFKMVFVGCALGGLANLAMNQGLSLGEASKVLVIIESFLVITLIGEHFLLNERENLVTKIIAVISATVGAILIRIS
ncbi:MAG: DMT family transporter [Candidatus Shapirobacteria bacterium]|jgi:drug/metabolite transporter (DMT)-like permease